MTLGVRKTTGDSYTVKIESQGLILLAFAVRGDGTGQHEMGLMIIVALQSVFLQTVDEGAPGDVQILRRSRLIPFVLVERLPQNLALHLFQINPIIRQLDEDIGSVTSRRGQILRQIIDAHRVTFRDHRQTFDRMLQLAHVPRPRVGLEVAEDLFFKVQPRALVTLRHFFQKVIGQQRDVLAPLAQLRRDSRRSTGI